MSDPLVTALKPFLLAIVDAGEKVVTDTGTDPATMPVNFVLAAQAFLATLNLQLIKAAPAEVGAVQAEVLSGFAALKSKINAL